MSKKYTKRLISILYLLPTLTSAHTFSHPAIDTYDKIAIEQVLIVFHLYTQSKEKQPLDPTKTTIRRKPWWNIFLPNDLFHLAKPQEWIEGWTFIPFNGTTGAKWGPFHYEQQSMIGFVGYHREKKIITLIFRGTQVFHDGFHNLHLKLTHTPYLTFPGWIHAGYSKAFTNCQQAMEDALKTCIHTLDNPQDYTLIISGHSFGGSVATLAAAYLSEHTLYTQYFSKERIRLITFGAPIVGMCNKTGDFRAWMKQKVPHSKRFVRETDIGPTHVTHIAKTTWHHDAPYPSFDLFITPAPVGMVIKLPGYGAQPHQWYEAHDPCGYQRAIYESLGLHKKYRPLIRLRTQL